MQIIPVSQLSRISFLFFFFAILSCSTTSEWQKAANAGSTEAKLMADIGFLAHDKLEGRAFGSEGETLAGAYIAKRYKLLGLQPKGEKGGWFQSLTVKNPSPHGVEFGTASAPGSLTGRNVIGYMDQGALHTIVLGAHFDHLGMGTMGSLHTGGPAIHNGADDNASGIALILELADRLKSNKKFNYLFIAFTGEENGLWGSNYYCDHPTIDLSKVTAMLNFDMVGRLNRQTNSMIINGVGTSSDWPDLVKKSNVYKLDIKTSESGIGPSDHTSFYLEDIPVLHFFTGAHEDYHKPSDDVQYINAAGIDVITSLVVTLIANMTSGDKIPFTKTKDPDPSTTPKMEVTLGVLPDYLYDGKGLRIDGVREGKPAATAGMLKGDIIIKMDGDDVADIYGYMKILGTFHKGDKTDVVVLREGNEMKFDIQF